MTGSSSSTEVSATTPHQRSSLGARERKEEVAAFIELLFWRNGVVPIARDLREQIPDCNISDDEFKQIVTDPKLRKYLTEDRGVPLDAQARLTGKQLDWIRIITDPTDMRSLTAKMKDVGITKADVTKWNMNKFYAQVLYEQSNRSFGSARFGVLRQLQIEAMSGNITAIKMYLEMTGDYSQKSEVNVNVEVHGIINTVVDTLQELVSPEIMLAVVERLEGVAIPGLPGASPLQVLPAPPRMATKALPKPKRTVDVPFVPDPDDPWA